MSTSTVVRVSNYVPSLTVTRPTGVGWLSWLRHSTDTPPTLHHSLTCKDVTPARPLPRLTKHPLRVHLVKRGSGRAEGVRVQRVMECQKGRKEEEKKGWYGLRGVDVGDCGESIRGEVCWHGYDGLESPLGEIPPSTTPSSIPAKTGTWDVSTSHAQLRFVGCELRSPSSFVATAVARSTPPASRAAEAVVGLGPATNGWPIPTAPGQCTVGPSCSVVEVCHV